MGFRNLQELRAYQVTRDFKLEVYRLVRAHPAADADRRFRDQLCSAAASAEMNIAEGFRRYSAGDFSHHLRIALSSLEEAKGWVQDGIDRGHFRSAETQRAFSLNDEATRLIVGLIASLRPFISRSKADLRKSRKEPTNSRR